MRPSLFSFPEATSGSTSVCAVITLLVTKASMVVRGSHCGWVYNLDNESLDPFRSLNEPPEVRRPRFGGI